MGDKLCTLRELEDYYSYEDALNMAEIVQVRNYNDRVAMDNASKR